MELVDEIRTAWAWTGLEPASVVGENDFGNLIVEDVAGKYWRICPEDCYCRIVAHDREELDRLSQDQAFLHDWYMKKLVELARDQLGSLPEGRKYCLKIPAILGGDYVASNMATISLIDLIRFSGHFAKQTEGLADGTAVQLKIVE